MKTKMLTLSIALATGASQAATCTPETGRFETKTIEDPNKTFVVVTDAQSKLEWHKCPLGLTGNDCTGDVFTGKASEAEEPIKAFNDVLTTENAGWRLPTAHELLTITDQSCLHGTYTDIFTLGAPIAELENLHQLVVGFKEKLDILYGRHAMALDELNKVRESDSDLDKKLNEWAEVRAILYNGGWTPELSKQEREQYNWLDENVPEFKAVRVAMGKFTWAERGNEDIGMGDMYKHYQDNWYLLAQNFVTDGGAMVAFNIEPKLGVGSDNLLNVHYTYTQSTVGRFSDWGKHYVRLVRNTK